MEASPQGLAGPPETPGFVAQGGVEATWGAICDGMDKSPSVVVDPIGGATVLNLWNQSIPLGFPLRCPPVGENCTAGCLYDLDNDPEEMHNVAKGSMTPEQSAIHADMMNRLKAYATKWSPTNTNGVFNPVRNGNSLRCASASICQQYYAGDDECGADFPKCGSEFCSDDEAAYDPDCYPDCLVCPPGIGPPACTPTTGPKMNLMGCTNPATCHKFTDETGFYSWVAPSAGPDSLGP